MKTIDGLYFYEFILLVLGVLLFITMLVILIVFVIQRRGLKELIIFFFLPVIMIGYPSIQKIKYENGVISLEKQAKEVALDPKNNEARNNLKQTLEEIENRPSSNSKSLVTFGKAQAVLGDTVKAEKFVDRALRISPNLSEAKKLQSQFNTNQVQIERIISDIKENPGDLAKKTELKNKISNFAVTPNPSVSVLTTAAKAHASLGDTAKTLKFVNATLNKDMNNTEAKKLRDRFSKKSVYK